MIGTSLGHYRILRLVGTGGMGDVYAAEDLTLGRTVALKILTAGLATLPDARERFEREARTAASLTHPGIVTLHSFEQSDGVHFITMELVEGTPLSSRIPPGGLPFDELLRTGIELADAVSAAHERGVFHRDLKPANVLLTKDGHVKILDFGLAKLQEPAGLPSDQATRQLTGEGRIVGTVAYMSPEQAEARPVDQRTDIFSLGVMLYQMATGQLPFQGDTTMSVLSAILKENPRPATELNPVLPRPFARVLKACLQKDPDRRYQSAKDLRNELQMLKEELESGELARPVVAPGNVARRRWPVLAGVAAGVAIAAAAFALWPRSTSEVHTPLTVLHTQLTSGSGMESDPAISADGKWFLFVSDAAGQPDIYLQSVTGQTAINLTKDSPAADSQPAFSNDGESIAFRSGRDGGGLYIMGRTGEAPRRVASEGFDPAWSPDGRQLVYATATAALPTARTALSQLKTVDVQNGEMKLLTDLDGVHPVWSPNGRFVAFWGLGRTPSGSQPTSARDIFVVPASGGAPWRITEDPHVDWSPFWSADGTFIYFVSNRGGSMNLWRIAVDPDTGKAVAAPEPVTTPTAYVGRARMSASGADVVFEARVTTSNIHGASFDPATAAFGPVEQVTSGTRSFRFMDPSPDGKLLVLGTGYLQQEDLFISATDGTGLRQLTTDSYNDRYPEWAPDGSSIAFYSDRTGKYEIWTITTTGQLRQITDTPEYSALYPKWAPDGTRMSFSDITGRRAIVLFDPRRPWREQEPEVLPAPDRPGSILSATGFLRWSPDGKQLAGVSNGRLVIYDVAERKYRYVGAADDGVYHWLQDGRLFVGPPEAPRLIDPRTGTSQPVTGSPAVKEDVIASGGSALHFRLSPDDRRVYFPITHAQSDIWLARIEQ